MNKQKLTTTNDNLVDQIKNDRKLRVTLAHQNHYLFFHIYFPHYVTFKTADMHRKIFSITENKNSELDVIVAFRDSGKSTIVSLSYALWAILGQQEKHFVLLVSQTQDQAQRLLGNIKRELEQNELLNNDFGFLRAGSSKWGKDEIILNNNQAKITATSIEQSIRGIRFAQYRPEVIIADDIEDYNSTSTQKSRNKTFNVFKGEITLARGHNTRIIVIGNLLHEDALIMRLARAIKSGKQLGNYYEFPIVRNGHSLWPARYQNEKSLEKLRKTINDEVSYKREFLLKLTPRTDQIIHPAWIHRYNHIPDKNVPGANYKGTFVAIDPAISEASTADLTAAVTADVFGSGENLKIYIHPYPISKKINFPRQREEIKKLSEALDSPVIYIEEIAYQKALIQQLNNEGFYNVEGAKIDGDKFSRLNLTSHYIKNGTILFPKTGCDELIYQLTDFGVERYDDLADAFAILVLKIIENYRSEPPSFDYTPSDDNSRPFTAGWLHKVW